MKFPMVGPIFWHYSPAKMQHEQCNLAFFGCGVSGDPALCSACGDATNMGNFGGGNNFAFEVCPIEY